MFAEVLPRKSSFLGQKQQADRLITSCFSLCSWGVWHRCLHLQNLHFSITYAPLYLPLLFPACIIPETAPRSSRPQVLLITLAAPHTPLYNHLRPWTLLTEDWFTQRRRPLSGSCNPPGHQLWRPSGQQQKGRPFGFSIWEDMWYWEI